VQSHVFYIPEMYSYKITSLNPISCELIKEGSNISHDIVGCCYDNTFLTSTSILTHNYFNYCNEFLIIENSLH